MAVTTNRHILSCTHTHMHARAHTHNPSTHFYYLWFCDAPTAPYYHPPPQPQYTPRFAQQGFPQWQSVMDGFSSRLLDVAHAVAKAAAVGLGLPADAFVKVSVSAKSYDNREDHGIISYIFACDMIPQQISVKIWKTPEGWGPSEATGDNVCLRPICPGSAL